MRAVVQRVTEGKVTINDRLVGQTAAGYVVFLGIGQEDNEEKARKLAGKLLNLRIMADKNNKMNLSIQDTKGEILVISQFTLYGDTSKGHRPSFIKAAPPAKAEKLYNLFITFLKKSGLRVEAGEFGAMMTVQLTNDGPVTIILEI
jgi:D-tyrosyl-tRNA(Tyr) deacylase